MTLVSANSRPIVSATQWLILAGGLLLSSPSALADGSSHLTLVQNVGEHQIAVAAGPKVRLNKNRNLLATGIFSYQYGMLDWLDYQFPLRLAVGFPTEGGLTWAIGGGISGFWTETSAALPDDPSSESLHYFLPLSVSATLQQHLAEQHALCAVLAVQWIRDLTARDTASGGTATLGWLFDPTDSVRLNLVLSGTINREDDRHDEERIVSVGGLPTDGYAPLPVLAVALSHGIALLLSPGWSYSLTRRRSDLSFTAGLSWRSDVPP